MSDMQNTHETASSQRATIGVLSITAVIMAVGIMIISAVTDNAQAIGMNARGGDYIVVTSQFNTGTENLVIVDGATKRMIVYGWDINTKRLEVWSGQELTRFPKPPQAAGGRN